ncbi:three component ABC system middle component [Hymenobacter monticola]|uniref:DUF6521 family protein n=1 Tax=Hymenobacter monticola TaxID=1705399 RepID=A0ABY4BAR7_9BACT|nr:three component ABC system middle component [Hymenobacter monticola]UOE36262.1 DUF6521 family protein [Hymenobacter monticola]
MLPWSERPIEANLFNPAFCALVLRHAIDTYQKSTLRGMDYSMAFVVLPAVLHKATREMIPGIITTKLHVWAQRHHEVRIGFANRMQNMVPITKEAVLFGVQHGALRFNEDGALVLGQGRLNEYDIEPDSEAAFCLKKATFVGRWFADAGTTATLLAAWGVKIN